MVLCMSLAKKHGMIRGSRAYLAISAKSRFESMDKWSSAMSNEACSANTKNYISKTKEMEKVRTTHFGNDRVSELQCRVAC